MARLDNTVEANQYIEYQALGLALLRAKGAEGAKTTFACCPATLTNLPELPQRSIVLIDEIDKAPRDVPNDILSEIENMEFTIPELQGVKISLSEQEQKFRPIVIITSNSERDLPPAFLRRCVYFHVPFPPFAAAEGEQKPRTITVESIVYSRFGKRFEPWPVLLEQALGLCQFLRQQQYPLTKKPSLAEVLNWLDYLQSMTLPAEHKNLMLKDLDQTALLVAVKTTLLKTKTDQARGGELLNQWLSNPHIQPTAE
jgi:MoxR-like ATPase